MSTKGDSEWSVPRTMTIKEDLVILQNYYLSIWNDLVGLKKFTKLLPNNWLAETPKALALMRLGRQSAERERISEKGFVK
ncbi:hypothetical protein [Peribacillus sp. NPDC096540]|uniref:hypothetical protein n=1 Tax=Peribacillus sp. NPDC096540 TaxID=3390612 RepID=UPI003CFCCDC9